MSLAKYITVNKVLIVILICILAFLIYTITTFKIWNLFVALDGNINGGYSSGPDYFSLQKCKEAGTAAIKNQVHGEYLCALECSGWHGEMYRCESGVVAKCDNGQCVFKKVVIHGIKGIEEL